MISKEILDTNHSKETIQKIKNTINKFKNLRKDCISQLMYGYYSGVIEMLYDIIELIRLKEINSSFEDLIKII